MTKQNDVKNVPVHVDDLKDRFECDANSVVDLIDAEIAAYLDDELSEEERLDFERRLESDFELKERFETHRSVWNALDLLVEPPSGVDVTESTVERLNSETRSELVELNARKRRRSRIFSIICINASFVFVVLGYFLFSLFFPNIQKQRVKDQNVVGRLAQLEAVGNFEYLVALSQADFFAKRPRNNFVRAPEEKATQATPQESIEDARSYEESSQDRSFYRLQQRFERLDESAKENWRLLWKKIETSPNRDLLLKTLDDYSEWLTNFANDEERERLQTESVSERIADVRRKNEELARFWDRFPLHPQVNDASVSVQTPDGRSEGTQETDNFKPFPSEVSAPSSPFATQMFMLRNLLPEELRREDFRSVYQKYEIFRRNNGLGDKTDDGVLNFLKSESNVYDVLSEDAKQYLVSLSEDERSSVLSLITALCVSEKNASDYFRQNAFRRPSAPANDDFRSEPFGTLAPRQNVSIRELANDLRNAESNVRDYITSRPAQEAQALLFGLHWGGRRIKFGVPSKASNTNSFVPTPPFDLSPLQQSPSQRFGVPDSDRKSSRSMDPNKNDARSQRNDFS